MVYTLPPRHAPQASLGNTLGQGLKQSFLETAKPAIQQQYQRGQIQEALGGLKNLPSNASPTDVMTALIEATAGIPGAERYVGQLAPLLLQRAQANQTPGLEQIKGGGIGSEGKLPGIQAGAQISQPQQQQPQPNQQFSNPSLAEGENLNLRSFLPYDIGQQITPDQRFKILDQVKKQGGDVDFTRDQIDQYNAGQLSITDLANKNVDKAAANQEKQIQKEAQVSDYLANKLPADTDPSTQVLYQSFMGKNLATSKGLDDAYLKTQKDIANFNKQRDTWIKNVPEGPGQGVLNVPYGIPENKVKQLHSSAKPMLATDPVAYNILESAMVQKGNTIIDASHVLKPVSPSLHNILNGAEDYRDYIYPKFNISDRVMERNIDEAQAKQAKEAPKLAKELAKNWSPEVSLLNIYTDLSRKGWFPDQIRMVFDELAPQFDSQQQVEFTQLNQHPQIPIRYLTK